MHLQEKKDLKPRHAFVRQDNEVYDMSHSVLHINSRWYLEKCLLVVHLSFYPHNLRTNSSHPIRLLSGRS